MNNIDFEKLTELVKPLQIYVTNKIHPNVTIIVTPESFKVCEDIAFTNT